MKEEIRICGICGQRWKAPKAIFDAVELDQWCNHGLVRKDG